MHIPTLNIIAVLSTQTRAIGKDNALLWHIPDDLQHFKKLTMGHPIIMGRNTFESIGTPLPGRVNIVLTRDVGWSHEGVVVCHSFEEALAQATDADKKEIFIIGGAQLYTLALPRADRLYLTLVNDAKEGDVYFPEYSDLPFIEKAREDRAYHELAFAFVTLERTARE